jgi:hypothetical protein
VGKKPSPNGVVPLPLQGLTTLLPQDDASSTRWPNVWACLMPHWSEGKCTRQSGGIRVKLVGSWFVCTLSCPTEGLECDLTTATLVDLLDQLEAILSNGTAVWRPDWSTMKKARQAKV